MTNLLRFFNEMIEKDKLERELAKHQPESIVNLQMRTQMRDIIADTPSWGFKEIMGSELRRLGM
ncbi:hypothetical protein HZB60_12355 [candidate division KSB1 bacterium]|nr:hypothetical protein [candidate division KSB1 bacterium]